MLQRLEAENLRVYLQDEHSVTIDPLISNAIGGIKLMVVKEQVPRALELIQEIEQEYNKAGACPRCHSVNVHFVTQTKKTGNWLKSVITWLFIDDPIKIKKIYRCFDCGYEFENLPDH